eukprot:jgi/Botrbrau1/19830/Bobra.0124s0070.1
MLYTCIRPHSSQVNCRDGRRPTSSRISTSQKSLAIVRGWFGGKKTPQQGSIKTCSRCKGAGAIQCPGCKGSGRNRANGNMFERWKCYDCQGFGLVTLPSMLKKERH